MKSWVSVGILTCIAINCIFFDSNVSQRRLGFQNDEQEMQKQKQYKSYNGQGLLYNTSCPLGLDYHLGHTGEDAETAERLSRNSGAFETVRNAMETGAFAGRKIVISGDSTFRQVVSSLSCLLHSGGFWESNDSYMFGLTRKDRREYYDARLRLIDGGEIFFAPFAGNVVNFWSGGVSNSNSILEPIRVHPIQSEERWFKSCKEGKPFYLDHYKVNAVNGEWFEKYSADNPSLEKVVLGKKDLVLFQGGHHWTRKVNLEKVKGLMQCMEEAKASGIDPGWPTIKYIRSTPLHFPTNSGAYEAGNSNCRAAIDDDIDLAEELGIFGKDVNIVGESINVLGPWGKLHQSNTDCQHWKMPGVPDLYAREIARTVTALP